MGYYKNILQDKAQKFKFHENEHELAEKTNTQFKKIEDLFTRSIGILKNPNPDETLKEMEFIYMFYDTCDRFATYILRDLLRKRSLNSLDKDKQLFILFEKLFKIFYLFDILKRENSILFCNFTSYKRNNKLPRSVYLKYTTLSAMSLPMAHLFLSYFVTEEKEIYFPQMFRKRGTIHLFTKKKHLLYYISCITCHQKDYPFCKLYFCALFNTFFRSYYLYSHILNLKNSKLIEYYEEMKNIE
ncbi:hypothetical protein TCON_0620 [Astathelohania contejeani]|uniref:Uncharacterized protein n=1 Tax=Astathelohania contejeani TaxID=164912 RepID=A0ABQ7I186_9MICR|nr:hypothetical protein TCON_0620 [Thelohania contejeani]